MLKINKITIENFRGLRLPFILDFTKGGNYTSAVLYGRNGTGKSSIVDAWEWLNSFEIQQLSREGVSFLDFPHKLSGGINCYISVDFQHTSIKNIKSVFNPKRISDPTITGEYDEFKEYCSYPNFLRYSDLQSFVYKTKAERYKFIAKFFGLEKFSILQDTIQTSIKRLSSNLESLEKSLTRDIESINKIIKLDIIDEIKIVNYLNTIGAKYGINMAPDFINCGEVKTSLAKIISTNPVAKELAEWKTFQIKQKQFYPLSDPSETCKQLEALFIDLKKDEEIIKQLILSDLYERSLEIIPNLKEKNRCPVCDNLFDGDLLQHISSKHASLETLNKKRNEFETKKQALEQYFSLLSQKITAIQSESSPRILTALKSFFDALLVVSDAIPNIALSLRRQLRESDKIEISSSPAINGIKNIIKNQQLIEELVSDNILELSKDERTKGLAQDFSNIDQIINYYKSYVINSAKVDYLKNIVADLNQLFVLLTNHIQTKIQTTFSAISADVVEYFNELESSNQYIKNPQIKLSSGKDKAVELEIEFVSEKVAPAFKILSESQVNSFGLAIFLASVKNFNTEFKFFILDDIVNSFDSFKRPRVSQLIAKKFNDFQVLILTHDQIFFDTVQRDFPSWQRYKFTSWDYNTGPRFKLSKNYAEEIQEYLDEDKPITAGQTLGRYLEWTLGTLNENLQTPIRYKVENVFTLSEFYDPLLNRLKDKLKKSGKNHILKHAFDQLEQGTIFRNYCAHWKNEANPFTTPEIEALFKKWSEIEQMIYCNTCKSFVKYENSTGSEYIKCNCGLIDLKADEFYI